MLFTYQIFKYKNVHIFSKNTLLLLFTTLNFILNTLIGEGVCTLDIVLKSQKSSLPVNVRAMKIRGCDATSMVRN